MSAAPEDHDVLPLLRPLCPHPDAVLQEGGHQQHPGQVGQHLEGREGRMKIVWKMSVLWIIIIIVIIIVHEDYKAILRTIMVVLIEV